MNISFITNNMPVFGQNNPQTKELHGLRNIPHLHCAICGNEMMQKCKRDEIIAELLSDINEPMKASKSIEIFKRTIPFLPPAEAGIIKIMEQYAKKYPDMTFKDIFLIPEIRSTHIERANKKYSAYQQRCEKVFDKVDKFFPDADNEQQMYFDVFKQHVMDIGYCRKPSELKKYMLNDEVNKFAENMQIQNPDVVKQIKALISEIPLIPTDTDRLICYFMGKKDNVVLQSLLRNHLITIRHLDPEPKTDPYQMFCLCERCNTNTGGISFPELFTIFQSLPENMKKYSVDIINQIVRGEVSLPKDYPQKFQQIINQYANPKITLPSIRTVIKQRIATSQIFITPEAREQFLRKYPKVKGILDKREDCAEQNLRIQKLQRKLRAMCTTENCTDEQINDYKFYIKLLQRKYEETKARYH